MSHSYPPTRTYMAWLSMRKRCMNPRNKYFHRYGGRGIKVCKRWDNYSLFLSDMGEVPSGLTLDRKNNDGNYEPGNCRWATKKEQSHNSSRAKKITFGGKTLCVREWEHHLGLSAGSLWHRLEDGWTIEKALSTPSLNTMRKP